MKRMLINATQPEERRLAIVDGQKLLDFETEIEGREQRKGNIYKAVVTRVEPSWKPVSSTTAKTATVSCRSRKSQSSTSRRASSPPRTPRIRRHQGRPGAAGPGREGRARQQGRGADHLRQPGRPLPGADAQQPARRRREPPHRGRDREELKENLDQLEYPKGMSLIARTAGIGRSAAELQWDLNYMLKLWTPSTAPPRRARAPS
jgi:ribonuclease E